MYHTFSPVRYTFCDVLCATADADPMTTTVEYLYMLVRETSRDYGYGFDIDNDLYEEWLHLTRKPVIVYTHTGYATFEFNPEYPELYQSPEVLRFISDRSGLEVHELPEFTGNCWESITESQFIMQYGGDSYEA